MKGGTRTCCSSFLVPGADGARPGGDDQHDDSRFSAHGRVVNSKPGDVDVIYGEFGRAWG